MYSVGPPSDTAHRGRALRVTRAARRVFDGVSDLALDPMLRVYTADLVRPYGLALREDLLAQGAGQSYGEMAEAVIHDLVADDEPVDLIVLAVGVHDIRLGRATACYLAEVCPGTPMAFTVCEQGTAAPFTALRLIGDYARAGMVPRRALFLVTEQSVLHYEPAVPVELPERAVAVGLLCEPAPAGHPVVVRQHADVSPQLAGALLADDVAALSAGRSAVTLVLGNGLTQIGHTYLADHTVLAPAGRPYTGPWWEFADNLDQWRADGRLVLLADYEPDLRYLCLSALDLGEPTAVPAARLGAPVALHVPGKQWT